jgi:hypothetical protein
MWSLRGASCSEVCQAEARKIVANTMPDPAKKRKQRASKENIQVIPRSLPHRPNIESEHAKDKLKWRLI